jgi:hypothetical protein
MDIDMNLVETEQNLGEHPVTSRTLSPVDVPTQGQPAHDGIQPPEAIPTAVTEDVQMDVDDDMEELYWNPPSRYGTPTAHTADDSRSQHPPSTAPVISEPTPVLPAPPSNNPNQEVIGPDQLLTVWMRVRHLDDTNPWSSLRATTLYGHKRKAHNKAKANKLEIGSSTQRSTTFSFVDWIRQRGQA